MLRPHTGALSVRRFLAYDMEWIPGSLSIRLVGIYDGEKYKSYRTVAAFLDDCLTSANRGKWFYAHAGGLADVQFVFEELIKRRGQYQVKASFSGSSAIVVQIKQGKNSWTFVDSYWLLRAPLADIAKSIGMTKTDPHSLGDMNREQLREWYATVALSVLNPYCENDCRILWHAIDQFENVLLELGGQLQKTIASSAMMLYRTQYLTNEIATCDALNEKIAPSYIASRVEVIQKTGKGYYYDINSSFPYAMTKPIPGSLSRTLDYLPDELLMHKDPVYFADLTISVPDMHLGPIPTRSEGLVVFPTGQWRSWFTGTDVSLLLEHGGTIVKVHEVLDFESDTSTAAYAQDLYERRRKTSDPMERTTYKLLLNSLYGKFAEGTSKQQVHIHPDANALQRLTEDMRLMPDVYLEEHEAKIAHRHVPISACITARARANLYRYMAQSSEVHYCDTDGFSTVDTYPETDQLGGLKLEKKIELGRFIAPKVYRLNSQVIDKESGKWKKKVIVKAKGFSLHRMAGDPVDNFELLVSGHDLKVERMARIRENLRKGITHPWEAIITKGLRRSRPKRKFAPDGTSRPWSIAEIEGGAMDVIKTKRPKLKT